MHHGICIRIESGAEKMIPREETQEERQVLQRNKDVKESNCNAIHLSRRYLLCHVV